MGQYTNQFNERHDLLDSIRPQSTSVQVNGSYVSIKDHPRIVAKCSVGAIAATGTLTFQVRQAQDSSGTGVKALKASAALDDTDDNQDIWLEIQAEELDVDNGFDHVRIEVVAATAASLVQAELLGFVGRYGPAAQPATLIVS
jgi:hypothetical protein